MWNQERLKGIYRQATGYKPKNVPTDNEFNKLEETYRKVRDEFLLLQTSVQKLKDYEHDGTTYKMIKESFEKVKGKQEVEDEELVDNMYKVMNTTLMNLSNAYPENEQKEMAKRLIEYNKNISTDKHEMNKKLQKIIIYIKQMKNLSIEINNQRTVLKNMQYEIDTSIDREKKVNPNANAEDKPEIKTKLSIYREKLDETRKKLKNYVNHENHKLVLNGLSDIYKEHYKGIIKN